MIAHKGQKVTLIFSLRPQGQVATVLSLTYLDQAEGQRGVQLDRELAGSQWWMEYSLEPAEQEAQ